MVIKQKGDTPDQVNKNTEKFRSCFRGKQKDSEVNTTTEITKSDQLTTVIEKLSPVIEKFKADNGIKTETEESIEVEKTDEVTDEDTTQKDIDYILDRRKERQKAKKHTKAEQVIEAKPEETKTDVVIETAKTDEQTLKTGPIDFSKDIEPVEKVKEEKIDPATYSVPVHEFTKSDTKTKSFNFNKQLVIIAVVIIFAFTGLIIFVRCNDKTTTGNSSLNETTSINNIVVNNIPYEDTGTTGTKTWTDLVINDDQYLIVGGLTGNIDGVSYKDGFYIGIGPGTHNLTITNGFRHIVSSEEAPSKFDFRVNQAIAYNWARAHIDRGPIPVAPTPDPVA